MLIEKFLLVTDFFLFFQQPGCNHTREEILCELYVVLDCSFSIREAEEFEHGHVISDVSYCAKHNFTFESKQNQTDKEIEQRFYDTYLKLLPVSHLTGMSQLYAMILRGGDIRTFLYYKT